MQTVTRYTIQWIDPDEPHSWYLMPTMYRTEEEAEEEIAIIRKTEARFLSSQWPHSIAKILAFAIEVPDHE